jgi:uncharacterized protein YmfQ (DUF2313 family)
MPIPNWTVSDFLAQFLLLMPRGRAWAQSPSSVFVQCMKALMPTYVRQSRSSAGLLVDGFPATAVNLLPQWQASVGLPNACTPLDATIAQQQAQVVQQFVGATGQTVAYYIAVAALYGYSITIVELAPQTRTFVVHSPNGLANILFRAGGSSAGNPLVIVQGNSQLECIINLLKPADTVAEFSYP